MFSYETLVLILLSHLGKLDLHILSPTVCLGFLKPEPDCQSRWTCRVFGVPDEDNVYMFESEPSDQYRVPKLRNLVTYLIFRMLWGREPCGASRRRNRAARIRSSPSLKFICVVSRMTSIWSCRSRSVMGRFSRLSTLKLNF